MNVPNPQAVLGIEDYLAMERASAIRHERIGGEIFVMTGASRRHNLIALNTASALHAQLKSRPCETYASDMRVRVGSDRNYFYPDIVVVCSDPQFEDDHLDTLLNPTLIIEVLSDSTEVFDRGAKFSAYRTVESLREYVLVSQNEVRVEHYARQEEGWLLTEVSRLDAELELPAIGCQLNLAEVYAKVYSS